MTTTEGQRPFVERVASETREYIQHILDENHRLVATVAELERKLQEHVAAIEEETRRASVRFIEIEQQNTDLANLYVASYQLHGTLDRRRVLSAIQEIVINLVGSEELAIFEMSDDHRTLTLATSFGVDPAQWGTVTVGSGIVGRVAATGRRFVRESDDVAMTACIPLKLDDRVIGAIAIFDLLPQKEALAPVDYELFDLLATHAATALFCTRIQKVLELVP